MEIPVYLFTGFLEAGKTKMVHETLADERFQDKEKTLVLLCEEGEEEYTPDEYKGKVSVEAIESEAELTKENLKALLKKHGAERVMVEFNGMWTLSSLYNALPDDWFVYQEVMCVDSNTFKTYNANMRSLMFDKLQGASVVFFNRCGENTDIMSLHSAVRAVGRQIGIIYEYLDGRIEQDNIEDPLPFDIDAPIIELNDKDYAIWYRDMADDLDKYVGKTLKLKGMVARDSTLPNTAFAFGRMVMTCCADDTSFHGLVTYGKERFSFKNGDWVLLTAKFSKEKTPVYGSAGPVFHVVSIEKTKAPEQPVATFN